jgi:hypothetical protein
MINAQRHLRMKDRWLQYPKPVIIKAASEYKIPILMIILHIPLGILLYRSSVLALLHPLIVFFVGLYYAVSKQEKLVQVAYVCAYLIGAEVLWRMAQSSIFWEFGKYGTATIMIAALLQRGNLKFPTLPLLYFIFLIPACFLTLMLNDLSTTRGKISFNMSGPVLLFISCWFFYHLVINESQLKKLLFSILAPLVSVAVATLFYTVTMEEITFNTESNFATSGGFGPNQVSSMLGLGVFFCFCLYLMFKNNIKDTFYLSILCTLFAAQSVMTFSRSGIYNAIGATLLIIVLQMHNLSQNIKRSVLIAGIGLVFLFLVFPYLNDFTGGKLQERFEETQTTNRTEIIESDLLLFMENPILGTGVGEAKAARAHFLDFKSSSHTEYTRLVSEHGILGIFSLLILLLMTFICIKKQKTAMARALVAGMILWSCLYMLNAGMRLAAPSFLLGFMFITVVTLQTRKKFKFENRN